jgi:hypothetical protein
VRELQQPGKCLVGRSVLIINYTNTMTMAKANGNYQWPSFLSYAAAEQKLVLHHKVSPC